MENKLRRFWAAAWCRLCLAAIFLAASVCFGSDFQAATLWSKPNPGILKIIHSWPDGPPDQDKLIGSLTTQGFGGVVCNVSFGDYLKNEAKWDAFARAVKAARQAGFQMWLYDEKGYPSAAAGGLVLQNHPEWQARGLLIAQGETTGNAVSLDLPPGQLLLAAAYQITNGLVDATSATNLVTKVRDRKLLWRPVAGNWAVLAVTESVLHEGTHADMSLADHIPYPNLLERAPTARFLELTHDYYARHLPPPLSQWFVSTFTDEPSLMSLFLKRMPYAVLPWSSGLVEAHRTRRGTDAMSAIPKLVLNFGSTSKKARHDYWRTVGELVAENYFGQIQHWCHSNNVLSGGHLLMEENLVNQVPLYGDFFGCLRRLDAPGIDCLTSVPDQVPWFIARTASSAAALEGKQLVMCETSDHSQRYRPAGDNRPMQAVTKLQIRGTCNRLLVNGINVITSYYSFADLDDADLRELNLWVARCCALLKSARHSPSIAVLYPTESLWPSFVPARHLANAAPAASRVESVFHAVSGSLFDGGWDFSYVDGRALADAVVEDGTLKVRDQQWRVVILPAADTLPLSAWENVSRFQKSGGLVISVGAKPANSDSEFPSARVQEIATTMFGSDSTGLFLPAGEAALVSTHLDRRLGHDFVSSPSSPALRYRRLELQGNTLFFVVNDQPEPWSGKLSFESTGPGQRLDPASGLIEHLTHPRDIPATLPPYGALFFEFPGVPKTMLLRNNPELTQPLRRTKLTLGNPIVSRGEFVREDVRGSASGHTFAGTLTKSGVDTFLFAHYPCQKPSELISARAITVRTSVPDRQAAPVELLVMLHEEGGADYLARSGRWLGSTGEDVTWLPLTQFQLAGWSTDANGRLDLATVNEIRIGWGGYYGTAGEAVEFTASDLRIEKASD